MLKHFKAYILILFLMQFVACKNDKENNIIPVNDFFKVQDKAYYRVSPDGESFSYLKLNNNTLDLHVEDVATGKVTQVTHLKGKTLNFYFWTNNNMLIYHVEDDSKNGLFDLYFVQRDGSQEMLISSGLNNNVKIIEDRLFDNKYVIVASNKRDSSVYDAYRLDITTGKMQLAAKNPGNISTWKTDNSGLVRVAVASDGGKATLLYRNSEQQSFKPVINFDYKTTFEPLSFSADNNDEIYAISNLDRDRSALVTFNLNAGKENKVLFQNDTSNVIEARFSRSKEKLLYVMDENWKKNKHYLDDTTKIIYNKIDRLLPNNEWRVLDKDQKDEVFVLRTFTDKNPGSYYLFNIRDNYIKKLSDLNPSILEQNMSAMTPISYKSSDGLTIQGYLTLPKDAKPKNLPVVVMPHDGPGGRVSWAYNADVQFLANRGYAVLQMNYRGSTGYGKEFYAAGFKEWNNRIQEDINDGVRWLIKNKIANPKKIAIYGTGMGGYLALNCLYKNPDLYAAGGSNSGVINLFSYFKTIPPLLTNQLQMFYDIIGNPITDTDFMRVSSPVFHADRFKSPVFIAQNPKDPSLNMAECVQFVKELKKNKVEVTYVEKEEGPNPIRRQQGRLVMYKALETFLQKNLNTK